MYMGTIMMNSSSTWLRTDCIVLGIVEMTYMLFIQWYTIRANMHSI